MVIEAYKNLHVSTPSLPRKNVHNVEDKVNEILGLNSDKCPRHKSQWPEGFLPNGSFHNSVYHIKRVTSKFGI